MLWLLRCPSDGEKGLQNAWPIFAYEEKERALCFHLILQGSLHRLPPSLHRQLQVVWDSVVDLAPPNPKECTGKRCSPYPPPSSHFPRIFH